MQLFDVMAGSTSLARLNIGENVLVAVGAASLARAAARLQHLCLQNCYLRRLQVPTCTAALL